MSGTGKFRCKTSMGEHVFENVTVMLYEYARPNGILAVLWREKPDMTDEVIAVLIGVSEYSMEGAFPDWSPHVPMVPDGMEHPLGKEAQGWGRFWHENDLYWKMPRSFPKPSLPRDET